MTIYIILQIIKVSLLHKRMEKSICFKNSTMTMFKIIKSTINRSNFHDCVIFFAIIIMYSNYFSLPLISRNDYKFNMFAEKQITNSIHLTIKSCDIFLMIMSI